MKLSIPFLHCSIVTDTIQLFPPMTTVLLSIGNPSSLLRHRRMFRGFGPLKVKQIFTSSKRYAPIIP